MVENTVKGLNNDGGMGKKGSNQAIAGRSKENKKNTKQTATANYIL